MPAWTCPSCGRRFGAPGRSHMCEPGMTADEFFTDPDVAHRRPVYEAVASVLDDAIVEPVQVGIFFKGTRTFAELRPKRDRKGRLRFELSVILLRRIDHPRVRRAMPWSGAWVHYIDLYSEDDVDDAVRQWLAESFLSFAP